MLCSRKKVRIYNKSYLRIFDMIFLKKDISIGISTVICSGIRLQVVKTTVSVSVKVLRKGIKAFIQT